MAICKYNSKIHLQVFVWLPKMTVNVLGSVVLEFTVQYCSYQYHIVAEIKIVSFQLCLKFGAVADM